MHPNSDLALLLVLVWVYSSESQNDYHANVITKDQLCTIPPNNGAHTKCEVTEKGGTSFVLEDCNHARCRCSFIAAYFTQSCVYNNTYTFTRTCSNFNRSCVLNNNENGGEASCVERYGECKIISDPPLSREAVGYPQYNPPICYPGFKSARIGCNSTSTGCTGVVQSTFTSTTEQELTNCNLTCPTETETCTNFTRTCNDTYTKWNNRYKSAVFDSRGDCDVITKKCDELRAFKEVPAKSKGSDPKAENESVLIKTYDCSITSNLTQSKEFCVNYINENMEYKVECKTYGITFTEYLIESVFESTGVSVSSVTSYLTSKWDIIKKLCKDDCFTAVTREIRNCMTDLPLQSVLPGITNIQLRFLLYNSADLLCASVSDKKTEESCVEYVDTNGQLYTQVIANMSEECKTEMKQLRTGNGVTCNDQCRDYLVMIGTDRQQNPGCCLADVMTFKESTTQWMEMMSPDIFKDNILIQLVEECSIRDKLRSCTETDGMHPAVIFVIAVIGIFSVAILSGVIVFIVVFYQQMEYEGYKKGFLHNIIT